MANVKTLVDYNRKDVTTYGGQVKPVVPEHFNEQYPDLVKFLEAYYEYLDSDGQFGNRINNLFNSKDIDEADSDITNLLFTERVPGLSAEQFPAPTYSYKLLPGLYKSKGTNLSVDGFFRYFYQSNIERILPRKDMFIVGESEVGAQSQKYIQDSYFYQIYSILIKTNIPPIAYASFYKNFLHPAGYAAFYENSFEEVATLGFTPSTEIFDLDLGQFGAGTIVEAADTLAFNAVGSVTHTDSSSDRRSYADKAFTFEEGFVGSYHERVAGILADSPYNGQYVSITDLLNPDSPRWSSDIDSSELEFNMSDSSETGSGTGPDFGDSSGTGTFDTVSPFPGIRLSNNIETFDEDQFNFYDDFAYADSPEMLAGSGIE